MSPEQLLFLLVMEECAEISQIASKIIRFGASDMHPEMHYTPNITLFKKELNDLYTILDLISNNYKVDVSKDRAMMAEKRVKIIKYTQYSEKLGRVDMSKD